jgi:hypothetical protein
VLEYSLGSLPAGAVITGATVAYSLTGVLNGVTFPQGVGTSTPPILSLSMFDGGDGVVTLADMLKPDVEVGLQTAPVVGLNTFTLADLSGLNLRPGPYVGFSLLDVGAHGSGASMALGASGPILTIDYVMAPEPASAGVLGAGVVLLLRRRRGSVGSQG